MILATIMIQPSSDQRAKALEILRSVQGPTQVHPGCVTCRIFDEEGPEQAILFCEGWESEGAFHQHVRSDLYRRILSVIELSTLPPEVYFQDVSSTRGIELIRELRSHGEEAPDFNHTVADCQP